MFTVLASLFGCRGSDPDPLMDGDAGEAGKDVATDVDRSTAERLVRDWRWQHRLLVVRSDRDASLARQASLVEASLDAWRDREMKLVLLTTDGGLVVDRFVDGGPVGESFTSGVERLLVDRYGLEVGRDGIAAALVGKDGGVKARWSELVEPRAVFDLVDAMPMRIREMQEDER